MPRRRTGYRGARRLLMNRRRFLTYALGATAGAIAVGTWRWVDDGGARGAAFVPDDERAFGERLERLDSVIDDDDRSLILALVPDLESAIAIGRHARPVDSAYQREDAVLDRLRNTLLDPWRRTSSDLGAFVDTYRAVIARDHSAGRVIVLDGWVLSVTRVDVCVMASLVYDRVGSRVVAS